MKAILMSIKHRHIENIHSGAKTNELRTKPPKIECPFKAYNFDTVSSGGCGKVVSEWICDSMETYRLFTKIPKHLLDTGCVTSYEIMKYTESGIKDLTAMHISNLVIYDKPKELREFRVVDKGFLKECSYRSRVYNNPDHTNGALLPGAYVCNADFTEPDFCRGQCEDAKKPLTRPPQSWCYLEEV
ncbi:MAG: hypothetical protein ACI4IR_06935 [Eubacterium sp.]